MNLCNDLKLTIVAEEGVVRIKLSDDLNMTEVQVSQEINITEPPSRKYHLREAVVIALRRLVADAFREGLINDSLGSWTIANIEVEMDDIENIKEIRNVSD